MSSLVCIGLQWGDEGKGKIVDSLAKDADMVVRYNGGNNAGHTLVINGQKTIVHIVPTGAMRDNIKNVIGSGVLVDPIVLAEEIQTLQSLGKLKEVWQLSISPLCAVITPEHKEKDAKEEDGRGAQKIGTTKRGIGPCFEDKVGRKGFRIGDLVNQPEKYDSRLSEAARIIKPYVKEVRDEISFLCKNGKVLFEGAQGSLLDIDYGTYPFVTSSHCLASYAAVGSGVSHRIVGEALGVTKAYCTRVGAGPFPTQMDAEVDEAVRQKGGEFGATTGRPRKCGWIDLVALKRACTLDEVKKIYVTKIDILAGMPEIKACVAYKINGQEISHFPTSSEEYNKVEPVYETYPGFTEEQMNLPWLPENAEKFIQVIQTYTGAQVVGVGTGPGREQERIYSNPWAV